MLSGVSPVAAGLFCPLSAVFCLLSGLAGASVVAAGAQHSAVRGVDLHVLVADIHIEDERAVPVLEVDLADGAVAGRLRGGDRLVERDAGLREQVLAVVELPALPGGRAARQRVECAVPPPIATAARMAAMMSFVRFFMTMFLSRARCASG